MDKSVCKKNWVYFVNVSIPISRLHKQRHRHCNYSVHGKLIKNNNNSKQFPSASKTKFNKYAKSEHEKQSHASYENRMQSSEPFKRKRYIAVW